MFAPVSPGASKTSVARLKAIFISSHYPESLENFFAALPRLRLDPEHNIEIQEDVSKYIDDQMHDLACAEKRKPKLSKLRCNVRNKLIEGANGSYLWVRFAIQSLKDVIQPLNQKRFHDFLFCFNNKHKRPHGQPRKSISDFFHHRGFVEPMAQTRKSSQLCTKTPSNPRYVLIQCTNPLGGLHLI
jgi:hypothetical protein